MRPIESRHGAPARSKNAVASTCGYPDRYADDSIYAKGVDQRPYGLDHLHHRQEVPQMSSSFKVAANDGTAELVYPAHFQ